MKVHILFIFIHLFPGRFKFSITAERFSLALFLLVNGVLIVLNLIDTEYFDFTHKRSTIDLFSLAMVGNDIKHLIPMFLGDYWYLGCVWLGLMLIITALYPSEKRIFVPVFTHKNDRVFDSLLTVTILLLVFAGARGKIGEKLKVQDAVQYVSKVENIPAVLNTPFSMMESINKQALPQIEYDKLLAFNEPHSTPYHSNQLYRQSMKNVVVIILESFSAEYSKYLSGFKKGYTPFLDSLMQEGLHFTNAFANGKKSIEAVPSVFCGVPALMTNPVITSDYAGNHFASLPGILRKFGYTTAFYHGAANGSMGFENFCLHIGFDKYKGMNEYPDKSDFDGHWGISDEPFLQFFARDLDTLQQPFMSGVFTLSSHHPYKIPEKYIDTFPEGPIPMLRTIAYADYALRRFFQKAQKYDWYDNTLFVITADHTGKPYTEAFSNSLQNYRVPLLFYTPGITNLKGCDNRITQQIDILPSVLDFLGIEERLYPLGNSVFGGGESFAINYLNGIYQFVNKEYIIQYDGEKPVGLYNWTGDNSLNNNLVGDLPEKAGLLTDNTVHHIADYIYRMSADDWFIKTDNTSTEFYTFNENY
ncbi:Lipoteichoic acid synthase 1 [Salinivirga cyanobacteriivorans]|uniref:Lipoteichoic acid synthase 1 n=2 Tax=Salinivirga cyanobacteriivorans TaxID=1307839 RepID=A0A0S2I2J6_9BACT|nr:Lipoteichoic acid synthase 1 [Salinivirga cyanobacteriivorans]